MLQAGVAQGLDAEIAGDIEFDAGRQLIEMDVQFVVELACQMVAEHLLQQPARGRDAGDDPQQGAEQQAQAQ